MGDRVILMQDGVIIQDDSPDDLYNRPATAFAASFIGSPAMNLVHLEAVGGAAVIDGEPSVPVAPAEASNGQLGLRPEDIAVLGPDDLGLPARVIDGEYLGADTILRLAVGNQVLRARLPGKQTLADGQRCRLGWAPSAAHLFGDDGMRRDDLTPLTVSAAVGRTSGEGEQGASPTHSGITPGIHL